MQAATTVRGTDGDAAAPPILLAIDGNSLVHRSFHAQAATGRRNWAVRGLLMQLVAAVERVRPAVVVVGFDDPDSSLRRETWPTYKAHRAEKLDSLVEQLACAADVLADLGAAVVVPPGLEADDVLASCATLAPTLGATTVVMTSDRDAFALIDDTTSVLRILNGGVDASPMMTAARLVQLVGVRPDQYRDFAALRGDPSDNLPGVRGVGPRTASRLLQEFGSAAAAFDDLDAVRDRLGASVATRLAVPGARAAWELNCRVMTMHRDVPLGLDLADGPGRLPFAAATVEATYRAHELVWTAADALCSLAGVVADRVPERPAEILPPWIDRPGYRSTSTHAGPARVRPVRGRPAPRRPEPAQLALFD